MAQHERPAEHVFRTFPLLFACLSGVVSIVVLGGGLYLLWAWYVGALIGTAHLVAGLVMTAVSVTSWYYIIKALSDRFQVVVWDMPGLGHSGKPRNGDYSLERHARARRCTRGL